MFAVPKLFNENGSDSFEDQVLVGGNPTGIANLNSVRYKWAAPIYRTMVGNFWIPQKISLVDDKVSIKNLEPDEDKALRDTLSFLIFMDSFQANNLPNIAEYITCPAVKNLLVVQAFQEVVHSESYQYILESLYPSFEREEIYNRWRDNPVLAKRNQFISKIAQEFVDNPTEEGFDKVLVGNLCLEGIYFYQGFNFFDQLAHRKKGVQTAKEIDYIRRDELTHIGIFVNVIKERNVNQDLIIAMVREAVENEIDWCKSIYGNRILGISEKSSESYVKWLANDRLSRLGIQPIYVDVENPYKHLEEANKEGKKRENFFESGGVTSYDTADSVSGWDDL